MVSYFKKINFAPWQCSVKLTEKHSVIERKWNKNLTMRSIDGKEISLVLFC